MLRMRFVFVPLPEDSKPHRIFRWVTLEGNKLAVYDEPNNLVFIDKNKYECLSRFEQSKVLRTQCDMFVEYIEQKTA